MKDLVTAILMQFNDPALILDQGGGIVYANEAAQSLLVKNHTFLADLIKAGADVEAFEYETYRVKRIPVQNGAMADILLMKSRPSVASSRDENCALDSDRLNLVTRTAAGAAHEINNPLGGILQSGQLLSRAFDFDNPRTLERLAEYGFTGEALNQFRDYVDNRNIVKFVDVILDCGRRTNELINTLLGYYRFNPDARGRHSLARLVDTALFLLKMENECRKQYQIKSVDIDWEPPEHRVEIFGDIQQIPTALAILMKSAVMRMHVRRESENGYEAGLTLHIAEPTESGVALTITDNGSPLDADVLSDFKRDFAELPIGGEAYHLSVARHLMQQQNGVAMRLESSSTETICTLLFQNPEKAQETLS